MIKRLPFLSRVAFLCNLAFLLSLLLQWKYAALPHILTSTIMVTGILLAPFIFNPICNLLYLFLLLRKKPLTLFVPGWLARANFIFLLLQILFALFFLHDPFRH
jgi:hypothetical protein